MTSAYHHPYTQTLPDGTVSLERMPKRTACRAATTADIADLTAATVTHDGIVLTAGQRLLVWKQTDPLEDGVYGVGIVSAGTAQLYRVWPLSDDAQYVDRIFPGDMVYVEEGTDNGGKLHIATWTGDPEVGTDAPTFKQLTMPAGDAFTASDVPIVDTALQYAATDVEAALAEVKAIADAGLPAQKKTLTATHLTLVAAAPTEVVNLDTALPANARVVSVNVKLTTPFSGGTVGDFTVDVGTAGDDDALIDGADLFAAAVDGQASTAPAGIAPSKHFAAGGQLIATFRCGSDDVADATAGSVTIEVIYVVLA